MEDYDEVKVIGRGSFGTASLVRRKSDGTALVIKRVDVSILSEKDKAGAKTEILVLRKLDHVNVIGYHDSFLTRGVLHIVLDYADNGDLAQLITKQKKTGDHFSEERIIPLVAQIAAGLHYVHTRQVCLQSVQRVFRQSKEQCRHLANALSVLACTRRHLGLAP